MTQLIGTIAQGAPYDSTQVKGYSKGDISKIEKIYDVTISGQFCQFMHEMGRCDGGLIGDDPIILYRPKISLRRHMLIQLRLEYDFKECRIQAGLDLLDKRPFLFSIESETQYFFVATRSTSPDQVYHYDENSETVKSTGMNFIEYMQQTVRVWGGRNKMICCGDILTV